VPPSPALPPGVPPRAKTRQKLRNVGRDGRIAVSMQDPENPYRYLEVRGEVDRVEDDQDNACINARAKKYLGEDVYPWHQSGETSGWSCTSAPCARRRCRKRGFANGSAPRAGPFSCVQ
jgi:hypothetical protein